MSEWVQSAINNFWSLLAFIANALIFLLVGVQLNPQTLPFSPGGGITSLLATAFAVGVVLLARLALVQLLSARSLLDIAVIGRNTSLVRRQHMPRTWRLVLLKKKTTCSRHRPRMIATQTALRLYCEQETVLPLQEKQPWLIGILVTSRHSKEKKELS
jgi:hypothetical protein